jgi:hypothetical protein
MGSASILDFYDIDYVHIMVLLYVHSASIVRNGAVLRELIYLRTKRLQNTGIAEAILKSYEMNIRFIYTKYDVDFTPCRTQNVSSLRQKRWSNDLE